MKGVQILLLLLVCLIAYVVIARLRNRLAEFLLLVGLVIAAVVFICFPSLTITVANYLGVGRGTDLIFYVSTLIFWLVILKLYLRQRDLEKKLTEIIRQQALSEAGAGQETKR